MVADCAVAIAAMLLLGVIGYISAKVEGRPLDHGRGLDCGAREQLGGP